MASNITLSGLFNLAQTHVVQIVFTRRDKNRLPRTRRMLLTLDKALLNSDHGKKFLHFRKPSNPPAYNAASKRLLVVWDVIMQDWRSVPAENLNLVSANIFPIKTYPNPVNFWQYYNLVLSKMQPAEKASFMDR
jgi:hypothetical protein